MALDSNPKVTPLGPGEPVLADAVTQQGSTFADRAKAAAKAAEAKQVDDEEGAENKSVSSSESKARSSRKK